MWDVVGRVRLGTQLSDQDVQHIATSASSSSSSQAGTPPEDTAHASGYTGDSANASTPLGHRGPFGFGYPLGDETSLDLSAPSMLSSPPRSVRGGDSGPSLPTDTDATDVDSSLLSMPSFMSFGPTVGGRGWMPGGGSAGPGLGQGKVTGGVATPPPPACSGNGEGEGEVAPEAGDGSDLGQHARGAVAAEVVSQLQAQLKESLSLNDQLRWVGASIGRSSLVATRPCATRCSSRTDPVRTWVWVWGGGAPCVGALPSGWPPSCGCGPRCRS